jgi:hypothetical protein
MPASGTEQLRRIGRELGQYVRSQSESLPMLGALQGVVADLAASLPDLQTPLRDLVSRQAFIALLPHALSAGGSIQRDALIQEISRVYNADVLVEVEEVLNGFLDSSGGIAISISQTKPTCTLPKSCERSATELSVWIKADISSSTLGRSINADSVPVLHREKLKLSVKQLLLLAARHISWLRLR